MKDIYGFTSQPRRKKIKIKLLLSYENSLLINLRYDEEHD